MKSLKLLQISILSLASFIFINFYENIDNNSDFEPLNSDEILSSCQIYNSDKPQITFENLENLEIAINIPNSNGWYKNLFKASLGYLVIEDVHKKNFKSNLVVSIVGSDKSCNYKSKVRVSGLVKANVTVSPGFSSMDLKIIEDNFLGMTSFKLFLPQMRGFDNEIFATTLMKHLGHLSPNTFWKEVTVNGEKQLFLIQEEINSDFLMNNLLREGPIIEANNRLALEGEGFTPNTAMFAKVVNGKWLSANSNNIKISQFAIEKLNRLNIFRPNNYRYSLNLASLSNENKRIFNEFAILMNSLNGLEALNWDDRKFYFEPVTEILYPIYYDGVSGVLPISSKSNSSESYNLYTDYPIHHENNLTSDLQLKTIDKLIRKIQDIQYEDFLDDLHARGLDTESFNFDEVEFKNHMIDLINEHKKYIGDIEEFSYMSFIQTIQEKEDRYYLLYSDKNNYKLCTSILICENASFSTDEINDILKGDKFINNRIVFYVGEKNFININEKRNFVDFKSYNIDNVNSEIFYLGEGEFSFIDNTLNIRQKSKDFKVLINDSFVTFNINFYNDLIYENEYFRYDFDLLTGCINIYNSVLQIDNIIIYNPKCEDGLNIVKSIGEISSINVESSSNDSIDFDFSELNVLNIDIRGSQNDCMDMSKGIYKLSNINLLNCKDKALSVGENSNVIINKVLTSESNIGIAVKDSSNVEISNYKSKNDKYCVQMYRKKEKFGASKLKIKNLVCTEGDIYIEKSNVFEK